MARSTLLASIGLALLAICTPSAWAQEAAPTPATALQRLKEGNARFAADRLANRDLGSARRRDLTKGQRPFAIVLGCADSRVTPEFVFDQGLGDLFVLRVAGNITDPAMLGAMEFALEQLKTPLIVVLGHEECGAVKAALAGKPPPGNLGQLIQKIDVGKPPADAGATALPDAIWANALHSAKELTARSPVIKEFVARGRVRIVVGVYSLKTGKVDWREASDKPEREKPARGAGTTPRSR